MTEKEEEVIRVITGRTFRCERCHGRLFFAFAEGDTLKIVTLVCGKCCNIFVTGEQTEVKEGSERI